MAAAARQVSVSVLFPATGETLCCQGGVSGAPSRIELPEAASALLQKRSLQPPDSGLVLELVDSGSDEITVPFSILSSFEEAQLEGELNQWNSAEPLLRHLGRAHVFRNWQLSTHEAEETEAALKEFPDSPYLPSALPSGGRPCQQSHAYESSPGE